MNSRWLIASSLVLCLVSLTAGQIPQSLPGGTLSRQIGTTPFQVALPPLTPFNPNPPVAPFRNFRKVMVTEVSWGEPDCVELANFSLAMVDISGWKAHWEMPGIEYIGSPLPAGTVLAPGECIVLKENGGWFAPALSTPAGTQSALHFPSISSNDEAFWVTLRDANGNRVDEVLISDTSGSYPAAYTGSFFGLARRGPGGSGSVERIWGLDSNQGDDWTEQQGHTMGRENTSSGPRGDMYIWFAHPDVRINEIAPDGSDDFIEIHNPTAYNLSLSGWFFYASSSQASTHTIIIPFPGDAVLGPGEYAIIGDASAPLFTLPSGVRYYRSPQNIPFGSGELECALYTSGGHLVDIVRTTGAQNRLVHNAPRAPSHWADFTGAARRYGQSPGSTGIARDSLGSDSNSGSDWRPVYAHTLGYTNSNFATASLDLGDPFDVRINDACLGGGLQVIVNAGTAHAFDYYNFLLSFENNQGTGSFLGLGADALDIYYSLQVFFATLVLDANGSARIDLPVAPLPQMEFIFLLRDGAPGGPLIARTMVLDFETP